MIEPEALTRQLRSTIGAGIEVVAVTDDVFRTRVQRLERADTGVEERSQR